MLIDGSKMKVGGNPLRHWIGEKIQKLGAQMISKNKYSVVTNPSCKLINPFTLIISFTVDSSDKYQVVLQGDYKKIYKETVSDPGDNTPDLSEKEMFMIIGDEQKSWFKKE